MTAEEKLERALKLLTKWRNKVSNLRTALYIARAARDRLKTELAVQIGAVDAIRESSVEQIGLAAEFKAEKARLHISSKGLKPALPETWRAKLNQRSPHERTHRPQSKSSQRHTEGSGSR